MANARSSVALLAFPAEARYLRWIHVLFQQIAQEYHLEDQRSHQILVGISEAFTNAVIHGSGNDPQQIIELKICMKKNALEVELFDRGPGAAALPPEEQWTAATTDCEGGRGLNLMQWSADELRIRERDGGGLVVGMQFNISDAHEYGLKTVGPAHMD